MRLPRFSISLRARLALLFGLISLAIGLPTYLYISGVHRSQLISDRQASLDALASAAATVLAENLVERRREVELLTQTPLFRQAPFSSSEFRRSLERLRLSYPHYSWIGLTDVEGEVKVATSNHLVGVAVQSRPWFVHGKERVFVGDVHEAVLLAKLLPPENRDQPVRFIDFASPVLDDEGNLRGVLGAHAYWRWAGSVLSVVIPPDAAKSALEVFIVNQDGRVIYPEGGVARSVSSMPAGRARATPVVRHEWNDGVEYLTAAAPVAEPVSHGGLGWKVYIRQPREVVLADVKRLQHTILSATSIAAVLLLLLGWIGAESISRPVRQLIVFARRIERGDENASFATKGGITELRQLARALSSMAATLLARRKALEASNRDLELKVAERTEKLQQLNQTLERLAHTDALTGLPNRLQANERLRQEFQRFKRTGAAYVLLMLDIDFFKRINDSHGHAVGDQVLKHVATLLHQSLRQTDFVARVGGEEFLIILLSPDMEAALHVAEKIRFKVNASPVAPVG